MTTITAATAEDKPGVGGGAQTTVYRTTPEPHESPSEGPPIPKGLAKQTIRHLIDKRWLAVCNNPRLLTDKTHRMDQSDIFYPMRTMLYRKGYDVSSIDKGKNDKNFILTLRNTVRIH